MLSLHKNLSSCGIFASLRRNTKLTELYSSPPSGQMSPLSVKLRSKSPHDLKESDILAAVFQTGGYEQPSCYQGYPDIYINQIKDARAEYRRSKHHKAVDTQNACNKPSLLNCYGRNFAKADRGGGHRGTFRNSTSVKSHFLMVMCREKQLLLLHPEAGTP